MFQPPSVYDIGDPYQITLIFSALDLIDPRFSALNVYSPGPRVKVACPNASVVAVALPPFTVAPATGSHLSPWAPVTVTSKA